MKAPQSVYQFVYPFVYPFVYIVTAIATLSLCGCQTDSVGKVAGTTTQVGPTSTPDTPVQSQQQQQANQMAEEMRKRAHKGK